LNVDTKRREESLKIASVPNIKLFSLNYKAMKQDPVFYDADDFEFS
jgi:hypothetical protein